MFMEFNEFVDQVVNNIPCYLKQYDIEKIKVEKVSKNNGVMYTGIVIILKGENIAPNIYLDYYYMMYKQGNTLDSLLKIISGEYISARSTLSKQELSTEFEDLDTKIFAKLVNYEKNKDMLQECPHIPVLDMAVTFRYLVRMDEEGIASALIYNKDMEKWGYTPEELYELAKINTVKLFPPVIKRMDELLEDRGEDGSLIPKAKELFVLSNHTGINGATCIIYEDLIKDFAAGQGMDLFILPSSIHEVILLLAKENVEKGELEEMVTEINKFAVSELEFLSDMVYFYDFKKDILTT